MSMAFAKYQQLEKSLSHLREADDLLSDEMASLWYQLTDDERSACDANAFEWGSYYQTDTIYQVVRLALFRNQRILAEQGKYTDFRNFNRVTINLSRRSGHTTAGIRLLANLPNSYLITDSHREYDRVIGLIRDEQSRRFNPSLSSDKILNINNCQGLKGLKAEYLIFDNASYMSSREMEELAFNHPTAYLIELG